MQYKTIALELIQEEPELYEQLRSTKRLLPAIDAYAIDLKASHEIWIEQIGQTKPESDPMQITAEAMELAVLEMRRRLPCASEDDEAETLSLDAAMNVIRRHTPPA